MALSRWRPCAGIGSVPLAAFAVALGCSDHSGTMKTPEGHRTPPVQSESARAGASVGEAQVGAERGAAQPVLTAQEAEHLAASAYIYAYPLMVMAVTKDVMTAAQRPDPKAFRAPINQAVSATGFPDPQMTTVVRPNFDTLYTTAWLDLQAEPVVVSLPDMGDRYYLMPMLDAWTNVVASPGTRTTGEKGADYVVTGPGFQGTVPSGMKHIKAPTRFVWLIGRIAAKPGADERAVRELQSQIQVAPLSRFEDRSFRTVAVAVNRNVDLKTKPPEQVARMTPQQFFDRFGEMTRDNPPQAEDRPILASLARLGVVPGKRLNVLALSSEQQQAVARGMARGQKAIEEASRKAQETPGWHSLGKNVGRYGTDYMTRAVVALAGLGANLTEDAVYPILASDSQGRPLEGGRSYTIRFTRPPPVKAFWSLTVYDKDGYVVKNPIDRYSIGSQYELSRDPQGGVVILLQPDQPKDARQRQNWLPTPHSGPFNVTMRLYQPEASVSDGSWTPPVVERND